MIPHETALLVAAALAEELRPIREAYRLCGQEAADTAGRGRHAVEGRVRFLQTGVGPRLSAGSLRRVLEEERPLSLLITGYAGALDPELRRGDLILARRAILLSAGGEALETWEMETPHSLQERAVSAGLRASWGDVATSRGPVEGIGQKSLLFARLGTSAVDMETAALARIAAGLRVPVGCVRVITDEAADTFPSSEARTYRSSWWTARTAIARTNLMRFFAALFQAGGSR